MTDQVMHNENLPDHYVESEVPETRKPPVTEVGPLSWLYKNLFSTWYNTVLTFIALGFIIWAASGLLNWIVGVADWRVITNNLRLFGTGRYPVEDAARVSVYVLLLSFLAGISWRIWGRMNRRAAAAIVIGVALLFMLPAFASTLPYPPSHMLIGPARAKDLPALAFVAEEGQTVTFTLAPTDDFTAIPVGFMDNVSLTTAGQIQIDRERAARMAEAEETEEGPEIEEEAAPPLDLQVTVTLLDGATGEPLESFGAGMESGPERASVTFPHEGWYVLQVEEEGDAGAHWLSLNDFEPMPAAIDAKRAREAIHGPPPEIDEKSSRPLDISFLIAYSGARTLSDFLAVNVRPLANSVKWGALWIALAVFAGYGLAELGRRAYGDEHNLNEDAGFPEKIRRAFGGLFAKRTIVIIWLLMLPILFFLVGGLSPDQIIGFLRGGSIVLAYPALFVFAAGIIPRRYRDPVERYVVLPIFLGAWVALVLIAAYFLGVPPLHLPGILNEVGWDYFLSDILPAQPDLILAAVGFVATLLVPLLIATLAYAIGRILRDGTSDLAESGLDGRMTTRAGVIFAVGALTFAVVRVFIDNTAGGESVTVGMLLAFIVAAGVVAMLTAVAYPAAALIASSALKMGRPGGLFRKSAGVAGISAAAILLALLIGTVLQLPEGGVTVFIEPPYDAPGGRYLVELEFAPETCDPNDAITFLFGAEGWADPASYDAYAFEVTCAGAYRIAHRSGPQSEPITGGQLSRGLSKGGKRPADLRIGIEEGRGAAWWGNSLLATFPADFAGSGFGYALQPGDGGDNVRVSFLTLAVWPLPEDIPFEEIEPDDIEEESEAESAMTFLSGESSFRVVSGAVGASVETFGQTLVIDTPKLLRRTAIIPMVDVDLWGGLLLTMVLAVLGNGASFPLGVLLALGRRSKLPVVSFFCTIFIEFVRGVPLVTILFMANLLVPLLEPSLQTVPNVLRALIGMTLFSAAYIAEIVRGGLQAIPKGQYEAAQAIGMNTLTMHVLIILPQALRIVIPALVGQFISLFKDTSLAFIVGLIELLGISRTVITQAEYIGLQRETFVFAAAIYFIVSYAMSYGSRLLEESGAGAARRL
jgi:His/Glu/Gln/Arg/opine family amino acid ABC transporter permease subunit